MGLTLKEVMEEKDGERKQNCWGERVKELQKELNSDIKGARD